MFEHKENKNNSETHSVSRLNNMRNDIKELYSSIDQIRTDLHEIKLDNIKSHTETKIELAKLSWLGKVSLAVLSSSAVFIVVRTVLGS